MELIVNIPKVAKKLWSLFNFKCFSAYDMFVTNKNIQQLLQSLFSLY